MSIIFKNRFFFSILFLVLLTNSCGKVDNNAQYADQGGGASAPIAIFTAKEIVTLDPDKPLARAVAVHGDRIVATGSLAEVKAALGDTNIFS